MKAATTGNAPDLFKLVGRWPSNSPTSALARGTLGVAGCCDIFAVLMTESFAGSLLGALVLITTTTLASGSPFGHWESTFSNIPGVNGAVNAIAGSGTNIIVGGTFDLAGDVFVQ